MMLIKKEPSFEQTGPKRDSNLQSEPFANILKYYLEFFFKNENMRITKFFERSFNTQEILEMCKNFEFNITIMSILFQ